MYSAFSRVSVFYIHVYKNKMVSHPNARTVYSSIPFAACFLGKHKAPVRETVTVSKFNPGSSESPCFLCTHSGQGNGRRSPFPH